MNRLTRFDNDTIFTAYNEKGELITYHDINDVPPEKRDGAWVDRLKRACGVQASINHYNEQRRKEAMGIQDN